MASTHITGLSIQEHSVSFDGVDWAVHCSEDLSPVLLQGGGVRSEVAAVLEPLARVKRAFRSQVHLNGVPLLVAFFPEARIVRVASCRMNFERFTQSLLDDAGLKTASGFRAHCAAMEALEPVDFPSELELTTERYALPTLLDGKWDAELEPSVAEASKTLVSEMKAYRSTLFERFSDWGLSLTADLALLRVHLLKFVVILPSLGHDKRGRDVKRLLLEALRRLLGDSGKAARGAFTEEVRALPSYLVLAFRLLQGFAWVSPGWVVGASVRWAIRLMARRFIAGETIESAAPAFSGLFSSGRDVTLDQLGELVVSEKEADHYCSEVLKLIRGFSQHVPKGARNAAGIYRAHISIKVSALCSDFKPEAFEATYANIAPRLRRILETAQEEKVFIHVDAEHYFHRDTVFLIYSKVLLETESLQSYADTGIVVQAYLRDSAGHLREVAELARRRGLGMPIRLVKGAYWDAETIEADAHSFQAPEYLNKEETDVNFRQLVLETFKHAPHLQLCLASHNFQDHVFSEVAREKQFPSAPKIEHQCLHMTYEALSFAMAKLGWPVRNYIPIGSLIVGMAYLVRRILENSSQVGILSLMRSHKGPISLQSPAQVHLERKQRGELSLASVNAELTDAFFNVAPLRLYLKDEWNAVEKALASFQRPLLLSADGTPGETQVIRGPSDPSLEVGRIAFATAEDVEPVVQRVHENYVSGEWSQAGSAHRAWVLARCAQLMLVERLGLAVLICHEAGKTLLESLADVDEAIDFLNFYAREERRLEASSLRLGSRGVIAVISPWNFPLAIPCGMVSSALVAGNTVILKSAEQTPLIAQRLVALLHRAGVPSSALVHLPGEGETVGEALVGHVKVAAIVFTGSKPVGLHIAQKAGKRVYRNPITKQSYPVKVIAEMGGKNAIVVTASAELDEAVSGILYSAFGHAGQKCSAASRVLVDKAVLPRLRERLREACLDIRVGSSWDWATTLNPMITSEDQARLRRQVQEAIAEAKAVGGAVIVDRSQETLPGHCVGPVLLELPYAQALKEESFAQRELFGPVVHMIGFDGFEEAIQLFNSTEYGLTGGVFSQSQDEIDYLSQRFQCGNVYINRSITGARVSIEPFGGFKHSGTGPKAGGRDYVAAFHVVAPESQKIPAPDKRSQNLAIPGQLSFNDFSLPESVLLLISSRSDSRGMGMVQSSLARGIPVRVLCLSEANHSHWKQQGLPNGGEVEVVLGSDRTAVVVALARPEVRSIYLDLDADEMPEVLAWIYEGQAASRNMAKVVTDSDLLETGHLSYPRSFAVNIMRHGAALSLEENEE